MSHIKQFIAFLFITVFSILSFAQGGESFDMLMAKADVAYYNEDYENAIDLYTRAISVWDQEKDGTDALVLAYNSRGNTYVDNNDYNNASADYKKAITLAPDQPARAFGNGETCQRVDDRRHRHDTEHPAPRIGTDIGEHSV